MLQARIDALSAGERRVLQLASVVGPVLWNDALRAFDLNGPQGLPALQHKAMVRVRPDSAFEGTREQGFQHHLLHQVTCETVLKADRRAAHGRTAAWLAARVGDRPAEYLAVTAERCERAGDQSRAIDLCERAAKAAAERFANEAAWAYAARMLALPALGDSRRRRSVRARRAVVARARARRLRACASAHRDRAAVRGPGRAADGNPQRPHL